MPSRGAARTGYEDATMKRMENEADRARRYSKVLVAASLTAPRAFVWPDVIGFKPAVPARWRAQLSLSAGALAQRRALGV